MATRSIVTSQPDVACDLCGRRLLRGETPDTYLDGGREPRTVCELCAPRAAQEGWRRGSGSEALGPRPPRGRRGVSLLDRLRQLREPASRQGAERERPSEDLFEVLAAEPAPGLPLDEPQATPVRAEPWAARPRGAERQAAAPPPGAERQGVERQGAERQGSERDLVRALDVFNAGEQPRRVAGVARSLGAPSVSVQPLGGSRSRFVIVVAWELCWYRYEVDLDDELAGATMVQKGMELDELPIEQRLDNAVASEHGELRLVG